ncbi:MAG TPA: VOC family protein [Vicinamibacterales bacterium]|nr:VOC family protein [Vicinamibacterales bacterium]
MEQPFGIAPPGYRLPDSTRVGGVRLQVSNLERSVHFYETVIGFHVLARTPDSASLGAQDDERALLWLESPEGARPATGGTFGLYHFAVLLPDRTALGRLAAHLSRARVRAGMADHLVSEAIYLSDPDGLGIEVYADRPRGAWRYDRRELVMTTEPLDARKLAEAGGGEAWQGLPAGSRIGHLHLHVGDLRQAEAFYHAALGFDKAVWSYPGALFFSAGGYHHHLGTNTWGRRDKAADDEARLLRWELLVPGDGDAAAAAESLAASGYAVEQAADGWTTTDPWGTEVVLRPGVGS